MFSLLFISKCILFRKSLGGDSTVTIYTIYGKPLGILSGIHSHGINAISWSPDGSLLAVACDDGFISLWEADTFLAIRIFRGHSNHVLTVDFSPNGNILASGSLDETLCIWDLRSGALIRQIDAHTDVVSCVRFAPDGTCLFSSSFDGTIRVWDIYTGFCLHTIEHVDKASVGSLALYNGLVFVASHLDGFIRVWSGVDSACLRSLAGHCNQQFMTPVRILHPIKSLITTSPPWHTPDSSLVSAGDVVTTDTGVSSQPHGQPSRNDEPTFNITQLIRTTEDPSGDMALMKDTPDVVSHPDPPSTSTSSTPQQQPGSLSSQSPPSEDSPQHNPSLQPPPSSVPYDPSLFSPQSIGLATAFTPTMILAGSEDGGVCIWREHDSRIQTKIKAHGDVVIAMDTHPSLAIFITGGMDRDPSIKIWTAEPVWGNNEVYEAVTRKAPTPVCLPVPDSVKRRIRPPSMQSSE